MSLENDGEKTGQKHITYGVFRVPKNYKKISKLMFLVYGNDVIFHGHCIL